MELKRMTRAAEEVELLEITRDNIYSIIENLGDNLKAINFAQFSVTVGNDYQLGWGGDYIAMSEKPYIVRKEDVK